MVESAFEGKQNMLESAFKDKEVCSSSDFERSVGPKEKEACSSTDFERSVASKHARAVLSMRPVATEHA